VVLHRVEGERKLGSIVPGEKVARGGARAPLTVEGFATAEAARQRRWHARAGARQSDGDVVSFGHRRWHGRDGRVRRGEARRGGVGSVVAFSDTAGQDDF
jgi:hypothetical protein